MQKSDMESRANNILRNIFVAFSSVLVFLLLAETATRIFKLNSGKAQDKYLTAQDRFFFNVPVNRKDPDLFWRLKPGAKFGKITVNSRGFRGKEFSEKKKGGTLRIITLGDSCTLGVGVGNDETYPSILESVMNRNSPSPVKYEIINAGVAGYTSLQGLRYLKTELVKYRPDIITVQFGFNDYLYTAGPGDKDTVKTGRLAIHFDEALNKSHFYRFVKKRISSLSVQETPYPPNRRVDIPDFSSNMKEIISAAKESGAKILLLNLPVRRDIPLVVNAIPLPRDTVDGRVTEWLRAAVIDNKNYYVKSDFDGPVSVLEKSVEKYPQWSLAHYFLARKYESAGEKEKAEVEFKKAAETDIDRKIIAEYNKVIRRIAENTNTPVVDLVTAYDSRKKDGLFLDERHPSALANTITATEVYNKAKALNYIE